MHTLRSVNMNLLVVLHALLVERSVSRAADKLSMSQSAVSHSLARLRETLGDQLFTQTKSGVKPTVRALELQPELEKALHHAKAVLGGDDLWTPASMRRTFHLAMSDYGTFLLLPGILSALRKAAPDVNIHCLPAEHQFIATQLFNGSIHAGFCVADETYRELRTLPLFEDRLVCLVHKDLLPAGTDRLTLEQYLERPHMVVSTSGAWFSEVDALLAKKGRQRRIGAVIPHYAVAPWALAVTDMVLTIPRRIALALPGCASLRMFDPPLRRIEFTYSAIWHPRSEEDRGERWFREIIAGVCEGLPAAE